MNEFAYGPDGDNGHYGRVRNPWNLEHIPGAQAVVRGLRWRPRCVWGLWAAIPVAPFAFPLHYVVAGIKPTYGRVSRYGLIPLSWSLDHAGPMAKTVEDVALLLQAMAGYDARDPVAPTGRCPIMPQHSVAMCVACVLASHANIFDVVDPEVEGAVRHAIEVLSLGASLHDVSWPALRYVTLAALIIVLVEASAFHDAWIRTPAGLFPDIALRLKWGLLLPASAYIKAQRLRTLLCREVAQLWRQVDVLLTPATMLAAPHPLRRTCV